MTLHHHFSFEWVTRHDMESNKCERLLCLEVAQDVDTKVFQQTCGVGLFKAVHTDGTVPVLGQPLDTLHVDPVLHLVLVPVACPPDRRRLLRGFNFVRTIFAQKGKCSPFLKLTPTL